MAPRLCPTCQGPLEAETIGRRSVEGVQVGYCHRCNVVYLPGGGGPGSDYPTSSADRREREGYGGPGAA
ncbi:MAG: hypothetical protein JWN67_417 [Actinomycetia bacterium]|nr:hypothetical protein [Actinomycetes bacterium]